MAWREVSREDGSLKGIEEGVKNSFWWVWLEEKDQNGQFLSKYIWKVSIPGKALCRHCNSLLNYSSGGKKDIKNHSKNKKHVQMVNFRKTNTTLSSTLSLNSSVQSSLQECNIPYSAAPNTHDSMFCNSRKKPLKPVTSALNRKAHSQALILSFFAKHSMPFTATPSLIRLTQELAKDAKTLQGLHMGRTKASYKLHDGLANHLNEKLLQDFWKSKFSFNVDQCISNAREKLFSILVSH